MAPSDRPELERILRRRARRLEKLLDRRGLETSLLAEDQPVQVGLDDASIRRPVATAERAGRGRHQLGDRIDPKDLD